MKIVTRAETIETKIEEGITKDYVRITMKLWGHSGTLTFTVPEHQAQAMTLRRWADVTVTFDAPRKKRCGKK